MKRLVFVLMIISIVSLTGCLEIEYTTDSYKFIQYEVPEMLDKYDSEGARYYGDDEVGGFDVDHAIGIEILDMDSDDFYDYFNNDAYQYVKDKIDNNDGEKAEYTFGEYDVYQYEYDGGDLCRIEKVALCPYDSKHVLKIEVYNHLGRSIDSTLEDGWEHLVNSVEIIK